ncbi:MAG: plastocyanin/azurin family copper-binding protein [Actinomycetota bacterium]
MKHLLRPITAAALAIGGLLHLVLYFGEGYDGIDEIAVSAGFPAQAIVATLVAVALLVDRTRRSAIAAAVVAGGSLVAFALSRTVGLLGFEESGLDPSPETPLILLAEAIALLGALALAAQTHDQERTEPAQLVRELAGAGVVAAVVIAGGALIGDDAEPVEVAAGAQVVDIEGFAFGNGTIEATVGETITFVNQDGAAHTVDATDGSFASGSMARGDAYELTVDATGTIEIFCAIHPSMVANIVVS